LFTAFGLVHGVEADSVTRRRACGSPPAGSNPFLSASFCAMSIWYARPVFFVSDLTRSLRFYLDVLGFTKKWHEGDGTGTVCQVDRSDCEIILTQDASRTDKSRLFLELDAEGLAEIRREIEERSIPHTLIWWGYDVIRIADPDGNELFVCAEL
jgi:catechol 2,3-dioxygenase-like lactoylglutathione lyase family enzyme